LTFVISGICASFDRDELTDKLKQLGAKVTCAVSGKTNFLIIGDKLEDGRAIQDGNKYKKAAKQPEKTKIIT